MPILDQFNLTGRVALVTGAAQGLGQAMAMGLAEAGADIALSDIQPLDTTQKQIQELGRKCMCIPCDLSQSTAADLNDLVQQIVAQMGRLDILVNNAGAIFRAPAIEYPEEKWDSIFAINVRSLFFLSQAAARQMKAQGYGKIINICSMLSFQGGITVPSYSASKSAVAGLTRNMGNEWAPLGINVNGIAPGYFLTANTQPLHDDPQRNPAILARIPKGRWGSPDELKGTVVYLASAASDYLCGTIINVDGGWLAR